MNLNLLSCVEDLIGTDSNPLSEQVHPAGQGLVRLDADAAVVVVLPTAVLLGGAGPRGGQVAVLAGEAAGQPHAAAGRHLEVSFTIHSI